MTNKELAKWLEVEERTDYVTTEKIAKWLEVEERKEYVPPCKPVEAQGINDPDAVERNSATRKVIKDDAYWRARRSRQNAFRWDDPFSWLSGLVALLCGLAVVIVAYLFLGIIVSDFVADDGSRTSGIVTADDAIRYNSRDILRGQLKDPNSLEILEEEVVGSNQTRIRYRTKNSFGATVIEEGSY